MSSLQVYVEYAVRNPMITLENTIESELFKSKIENFVNSRMRDL